MPNITALERRIQADRAAVAEHTRQLRGAVRRQVGSPAGLATGFAAGFAGGWFSVSRAKQHRSAKEKREQAETCDRKRRSPKPSTLERLRTLFVLTMPLWQRLMAPEPPATQADDSSPH